MSTTQSAQDDVASVVERVEASFDQTIVDNWLQDDPLGTILESLKVFLRAQRQTYSDVDDAMTRHLEQARRYIEAARQPVRDEELAKAVSRGISDHAYRVVRSNNARTVVVACGIAAVFGLLTAGLGAWWQRDRDASQIANVASQMEMNETRTAQTFVEAKELGATVMSAKSAAIWMELIRMNPAVADELKSCKPLKQPVGSACSLPIWTLPPPPHVETPATH